MTIGLCVAVIIALGNAGRPWDLLVAVSLTFVFTNYAPFAVEYQSGTPGGVILAGAASALAVIAGILLLNEGPGAARPHPYAAAGFAPSTPAPAAFVPQPAHVPPVPQSPAAGWYPDPGGSHGQRYWDGAAWTQDLRS
jgi:hypothetical protein